MKEDEDENVWPHRFTSLVRRMDWEGGC